MNSIRLQLFPRQTAEGLPYQHLHFELASPDGLIEPTDLSGLSLPSNLQPTQGVVIEGRGPIWLYGYLIHQCHATPWVGCYDPRLGGAVVVQTHQRGIAVGTVLKLKLSDSLSN